MREFSCERCGKMLEAGSICEIRTLGTVVVQSGGYTYLSEKKIFVCGDCL